MKICIIGAGPCGLLTAKYLKEVGYECTIYEQMGKLGGVWNYLDGTDKNEYGEPFRNAMYQNLSTNLPKECMTSTDFPFSTNIKKSYIPQSQVLEYYQSYASHFKLIPLIKFHHRIMNVKPIPINRWEVTIKQIKENSEVKKEFDAIVIASGVHNIPYFPSISGRETFQGNALHTFSYKKPEPFKNQKVLIIGSGPSGTDIARQICDFADTVFISNRKPEPVAIDQKNILEKPEVKKIYKDKVEFKDGTMLNVDTIIYATGYTFNFQFLSEECKLKIEDRWIQHLYKNIVNIEYPTMFFIGLKFGAAPLDLQARFIVSVLTKNMTLPDKESIMKELDERLKVVQLKGPPQRYFHVIDFSIMEDHYEKLAAIGNIKPIPKVQFSIFWDSLNRLKENPNAEKPCYKIVDENTFELVT